MRILIAVLCVAVLSNCSRASGTSPLPVSLANGADSVGARSLASGGYQRLYSFQGRSNDGKAPYAGLTDVDGTFYGTTSEGGNSPHCGANGCGSIFKITPSGKESLLYSFNDNGDGAQPNARLAYFNGFLYGTTELGGDFYCNHDVQGCGVVFKISTSGDESTVYAFGTKKDDDGQDPITGLTELDGKLYGLTSLGGKGGKSGSCYPNGTLFQIEANGNETNLYTFCKDSGGSEPSGDLLALNGKLIGTTRIGGDMKDCNDGCGTIFQATTAGVVTPFYTFQGGGDGRGPVAGVLNVSGWLYGTTRAGGSGDVGTVFGIKKDGTGEYVIYSFRGGDDGKSPMAPVVAVKTILYGTTAEGGGKNEGTVFSVTTGGKETVLHRFFEDGSDGARPFGPLVFRNGDFYGTTEGGGSVRSSCACGTVFKLTR